MQRSLVHGLLALVTSASLLVISACGSNDNNSMPTGQPGSVPTVTINIPQGAAARGTSAFGTGPTQVAMGTRVVWMNQDSIAHTATSDTGAFDTGPIQPGASASWMATQAGTFNYHCTIHPMMRGTLQVGAAPGPGASSMPGTMSCAGMTDGTPCDGETCARACSGAAGCGSRVYHFCEQGECHGAGVFCRNPGA